MLGVSITELRKNTRDYFDYVWDFNKELMIFNEKKHEYLVMLCKLRETKTSRLFRLKKIG